MPKIKESIFTVQGMSCEHCKMSVERALQKLPGLRKVEVNLEEKVVEVAYDPQAVSEAGLKTAIIDAGYEVVPHKK